LPEKDPNDLRMPKEKMRVSCFNEKEKVRASKEREALKTMNQH